MPKIRSAALLGLIASLPACGSTAPQSAAALPATLRAPVYEKSITGSSLLYVSDENSTVYVYTYPKGRLVQKLSVFSSTGECLNGSSVFVTAYNAHQIMLYAHGASKPSVTLSDPGYPVGCSVDPTSHNLAVANGLNSHAGTGNVVVWNASGATPRIYSNLPFIEPAWCSYDDEGNLFVDGEDYSTRSVSLAELPKGASAFKTISLNISLAYPPGHVQWDGKYITISVKNVVYRLSFSGSSGTVVGSTQLPAYWNLQGYSIVGAWQNTKAHTLVGTAGGSVGYFSYPSGSGPTRTLIQNFPFDAVVSPASR